MIVHHHHTASLIPHDKLHYYTFAPETDEFAGKWVCLMDLSANILPSTQKFLVGLTRAEEATVAAILNYKMSTPFACIRYIQSCLESLKSQANLLTTQKFIIREPKSPFPSCEH